MNCKQFGKIVIKNGVSRIRTQDLLLGSTMHYHYTTVNIAKQLSLSLLSSTVVSGVL